MNFKRFGRTANLFDYSTVAFGKYINASGEEAVSSGTGEQMLNHSNYIDVSAGTTYTFKCTKEQTTTANTNAFCWFDSSKQLISRDLFDVGAGTDTILGSAAAPTGAAYLIMNYRGLHGETAMLNEGSTALPYQPYKDWTDTPHYIMGTDTDTITTLPADIYVNDTTATVGLKGNMSQSGTPSTTTPIEPSECGERTGNLFCVSQTNTATGGGITLSFTEGSSEILMSRRTTSSASSLDAPTNISLSAGTYTVSVSGLSVIKADTYDRVYMVDSNNNIIVNNVLSNSPQSFTIASDTIITKIVFVCDASSTYNNQIIKVMLNTGSTAKPHEPYGYKIPILSGGVTTPVYLGEVQSTRKIKKLVLTGQENWQRQTLEHTNIINLFLPVDNALANSPIYSTIVTYYSDAGINNDSRANVGKVNSTGVNLLIDLSLSDFSSIDIFKTYLRQQYAAGTPVTVWYVLATPQTAVVNEPIRKIGDYADSVLGITIPTIAGANTLSVDTTLQPSEVTATYKGWHPVQSVHEKSKNLFDESIFESVKVTVVDYRMGISLGVLASGTYTLTFNNSGGNPIYHTINTNGVYTVEVISESPYQFVADGVSEQIIRCPNTSVTSWSAYGYTNIMLNEGSTALPYEPYWN